MFTVLLTLGCSGEPAPAPAPAPPPAPVEPVASKSIEGPRPPDVVLVSIDTLRPDHLGTYGYSRDTSPFMDGLAKDGVRFAHARSASPWTLPAHTTMLTGQLPTTHRVVEDDLRLPDSVPVLPELLAARGLHTGAAVATLFVSSMYRFDRGFDHFNDFGIHDKKVNLQGVVDMKGLVDDLEGWVKRLPADEPMFLFLHTYDVHYAYDPPAPYDTMFDRAPTAADGKYRSYGYYRKNPLSDSAMAHQIAQYDEAIRYVDDQLARLDEAFDAAGRDVRWVVTSDHGEEFGERGSWGHAHTLYAEQLRVPLIVSGPGLPKGVVVETPVGTQDIAPTIANWTGVTLENADGIDLGPHLSGEVAPPARPFVAETSRHGTMRLSLFEDGKRLEWDLAGGKAEVFTDDAEVAPSAEAPGPMRLRLLEVLGTPWTAAKPGTLAARKGRILIDGTTRKKAELQADDGFYVYPLDTKVKFASPAGKPGAAMSAAGGRAPSGALQFEGRPRPSDVDLDAETKEALKSIGYIHDGDE